MIAHSPPAHPDPGSVAGDPSDIAAIFGVDGVLAQHIPGFSPRPAQQAMAQAVAEALEYYQVLVAEAGTGTGKTFAYLIPALLSGRKLIVSTGTKHLQDQLFHHDLPQVQQALGIGTRIAVLKGRGNYLCLHRLRLFEQHAQGPEQAAQCVRLWDWAGRTPIGDAAELTGIAEHASLWSQITSSTDNCLGQDCPDLSDCFVFKARRRAQECDILVVNHHLLCADIALRGDALGELLPNADAIIVDEAHQLPSVATQFLGTSLSSSQLLELVRDTLAEHAREAGDMPELMQVARQLEQSTEALHSVFGPPRREPLGEMVQRPGISDGLHRLGAALELLRLGLESAAERGGGLESCFRRSQDLCARLGAILGPHRVDGATIASEADGAVQELPGPQVQWTEIRPHSFTLYATPLEVSEAFRDYLQQRKCAWVFTSATLAVGARFDHFTARLGLDGARTQRWESPFDYARQALLYIPEGMPDPNADGYVEALVCAVLPVLEQSRGRAFLLFTSHRALIECARLLQGRLDYPLLVQGTDPRHKLLQRFRQLGNAILLGTSSFWEGVDVRGSALSLVVIDRLPFASPADPILRAQREFLRRQGLDGFSMHQLPQAVLALKQGAGRLIRDGRDRGVLMLCDPRLLCRGYGRAFLDSLPRMRLTQRLAEVEQFFAELDQGNV